MSCATGAPLRIAVIGAGHLGRIHARLLGRLPGAELVGVVDPSVEARQTVARDCRTRPFARHQDLLGRIDAAVVAAPTRCHHAVGMELLENGVHVLVEKPIAATLAEADDLVAAAQNEHLVLQVGHVERFNPALTAVAPHVFRPKYIEAIRSGPYTFRSTDVSVVLDLMIHDLDVILSLTGGRATEVEALGIAIVGPHEDMAQARLVFDDGCVAVVRASRTAIEPERKMHVFFEQGYAEIDFAARRARLVRAGAKLLRGRLDADRLSPAEKEEVKRNLFRDYLPLTELATEDRNAILDELTDFVTAVRTQAKPRVTGRQGRDALLLAERILAKIAAHCWDGAPDGRVGPLAIPAPSILQAGRRPAPAAMPHPPRRKAG